MDLVTPGCVDNKVELLVARWAEKGAPAQAARVAEAVAKPGKRPETILGEMIAHDAAGARGGQQKLAIQAWMLLKRELLLQRRDFTQFGAEFLMMVTSALIMGGSMQG